MTKRFGTWHYQIWKTNHTLLTKHWKICLVETGCFRMSVYHVSNIGTIDAFLSTV